VVFRCQSSIHWRTGRRPSVKNVGYRFYATDFPSHIKVALPALSPTMESGTIINWSKKEGKSHRYFILLETKIKIFH